MLIILDEDIISSEEDEFVQFIDNLMIGYIEGNHLIHIKPKNLKKLYKKYKTYLSDRSLNALYYYEENHMVESKLVLSLVNHAIKIIPKSLEEEITELDDVIYHSLYIDNFQKTAEIQRTTLLGENLDDAKIYKIFSDYYIHSFAAESSLQTKCREQGGGGNTTAPTFSHKVQENEELCLTILDSDRKYPSYPTFGDTAKAVVKSVKKVNNKFETEDKSNKKICIKKSVIYIDKRGRELENFLPYEFLREVYGCDTNKVKAIQEIRRFVDLNNNLVYYLDYKNGLNYFDILNEKSDWYQLIETDLVNREQSDYCSQNQIKKDDCKCKIIPSLGSKILTDFLKYVGEKEVSELVSLINRSHEMIKSMWNDIGKIVFSWCCGREMGPANA